MRRFFALALLLGVTAAGPHSLAESSPSPQSESPPTAAPPNSDSESPALTIKVRSNLVLVRVVVRKPDDSPVTGLKPEDFQIYDEHELQTITTFSMETPESRRQKEAPLPQEGFGSSGIKAPFALPERFVGLVFDDAHLSSRDTLPIKKAAQLFLDGLTGNDRVGIYSTSGQVTQEFTSDREALRRAVLRVVPRSTVVTNDRGCPNVSYNTARQIEDYHDAAAFDAVAHETLMCAFAGDPMMMNSARALAQSAVRQTLRIGQGSAPLTFRHLEDVLRRLAQMPGERVMVLLSPGFLHVQEASEQWQIVDLANRANVVINTLDVRGLDVPDGGEDPSKHATDLLETRDQQSRQRLNQQLEQSSVLAGFAYGTGGTFFHNSNDLYGGLKLAASPEVSYLLGFVPRNLQPDGRYHSLEVKLKGNAGYSIQARHGYYAPRKLDPREEEERQIADDLHSRGETGNLFLELQARSLPLGKDQLRLLVTSRLAVSNLHFKEIGGKRSNLLRMITAIFDENGNLVTGGEKHLAMDLDDSQYQQLMQAGLTVNSNFDLKPGRYLVRQLVRDTATQETSARNQAIELAQ